MRKALIIFLLSLLPLNGFSNGPGFVSLKLQQIATAEGMVLPDYRGEPVQRCTYVKGSYTYPVVIEYNPEGVSHIGLDIFGQEIKKDNPVIFRFVERYMLELCCLYTTSEIKPIMKGDGVVVEGEIKRVLGKDVTSMRVVYSTSDNVSGTVSVEESDGNPLFRISFPLNYSLLSGMDKAELDASFMTALRLSTVALEQNVPDNLSRIGKNLYVSENGFYETPGVQNSTFFERHRAAYYPVCDSRRPKESVMSLLTAYVGSKQYTVHLTQHTYNYSQVEVDVPLSQLLSCCLGQGCIPFVGIERSDNESITASLFMVNESLGYSHTFKFVIDVALLDGESGQFNASVHTFTPIYNLHS